MKTRRALPNLVAILGGLLIGASLLYPWWSLDIEIIGKTNVFPYIIRGPATQLLGYRRTAQMPLLTAFLVACVVLALLGSVLGRRAGRLAFVGASLFSALAAWRFHSRALDIAGRYNMTAVNGSTIARLGAFSPLHVAARLEPGFYLNLAGAAVCFVAVLLHGFFRPAVPRATEASASEEPS